MKTERPALIDELEEGRDPLGVVRALTGPYVGMDRRSKWRRRIKEFLVEWWSGGVVEWNAGGRIA
jgi:hypothetical protein